MASDFQIFVNEPLGVVIAKCPNATEDLYKDFRKKMFSTREGRDLWYNAYLFYSDWVSVHGETMNNLIGKSRCNYEDGDEFDMEYGIMLAKKRLAEKLEKYWASFYLEYSIELQCVSKSLLRESVGHHERKETLGSRIARMVYSDEAF